MSSSAEAVEAAAPAPGQAVKDEDDGVLLIIIVVGVVVLVLSAVAIYFCTRKSEEKVAAYDPNSTQPPGPRRGIARWDIHPTLPVQVWCAPLGTVI